MQKCLWSKRLLFSPALVLAGTICIVQLIVGSTVARSQEGPMSSVDDRTVSRITFLMPPTWVILMNNAVRNDQLIMRRFGVVVRRDVFEEIDSKRLERLETISRPGTFVNSMMFTCPRSARTSDYLTFHMPDGTSLRSFSFDQRISHLEILTVVDGEARQFPGEYMTGDLFIDAKDSEPRDFLRLLNGKRLFIDFGANGDRLEMAVERMFGTGNIDAYMREALPLSTKTSPKDIRFLTTEEMFRTCARYKRTGKFVD